MRLVRLHKVVEKIDVQPKIDDERLKELRERNPLASKDELEGMIGVEVDGDGNVIPDYE